MNENDLRVRRTRARLRQALIELTADRGYEQLTVREIADHAQVGHRTFYRHYDDKEALLQALVDDIRDEFRQLLLPPTDPRAAYENTLAALRYVETHASLLQMILNSSAAERLKQAAIAEALAEGQQTFSGRHVPQALLAHHFASSMINLLVWWLESGMAVPREQMADILLRLVIAPLHALEA